MEERRFSFFLRTPKELLFQTGNLNLTFLSLNTPADLRPQSRDLRRQAPQGSSELPAFSHWRWEGRVEQAVDLPVQRTAALPGAGLEAVEVFMLRCLSLAGRFACISRNPDATQEGWTGSFTETSWSCRASSVPPSIRGAGENV